jgi:hypothetical protein
MDLIRSRLNVPLEYPRRLGIEKGTKQVSLKTNYMEIGENGEHEATINLDEDKITAT